jgi:hypothetical protein
MPEGNKDAHEMGWIMGFLEKKSGLSVRAFQNLPEALFVSAQMGAID